MEQTTLPTSVQDAGLLLAVLNRALPLSDREADLTFEFIQVLFLAKTDVHQDLVSRAKKGQDLDVSWAVKTEQGNENDDGTS